MNDPDAPDERETERETKRYQTRQSGAGAISIGSMSGGAVASGEHASAVHHAAPSAAPADQRYDDAVRELLEAVRILRTHLALLAPSDETAETDGALAEVEDEAERTGSVDEGRLRRLNARLQAGATAAAGLASAGAVAQAIAQLVGAG
ncbi:hypothetical protein [Streptomyces sp. NPDC048172]|uniref:hypothetical protein n=1 Tax=Streptomyces sp. NPDC048172 TaxID=3365505 RepID=UPI003723CB1E